MYKNLDPHQQGHPTTHTMETDRLERLKTVLSIPSTPYHEELVTNYIIKFCQEHDLNCIVDDLGSVLITKGIPTDGGYYPMIGAHMDTVHGLNLKTIKEQDNILTAWYNDKQVGIGGDDLAGVTICLELLLIMPVLKVGFFVCEEIGCVGSTNIVRHHADWFKDVGYMVEFDGPEDYMVTEICSGVRLFERSGEFIEKTKPLLSESMGDKMVFFNHPYTDVSILKAHFDFSCINISAGYYNLHSNQEYVVITEVEKAIILGEKIINELGYRLYEFKKLI